VGSEAYQDDRRQQRGKIRSPPICIASFIFFFSHYTTFYFPVFANQTSVQALRTLSEKCRGKNLSLSTLDKLVLKPEEDSKRPPSTLDVGGGPLCTGSSQKVPGMFSIPPNRCNNNIS
jgi:hypothetical protein